MGFKYFLKHLFKAFFLLASVGMMGGIQGNNNVEVASVVFLIVLLCVNITTTYDLGNGWFLQVTTGSGILGAFIAMILAFAAMEWVVANIHIVVGISIICYAINQLIELIKYRNEVGLFCNVTGIIYIVVIIIEAVMAFKQEPSFLFGEEFEFVNCLLVVATLVIFLINTITRASYAHSVED